MKYTSYKSTDGKDLGLVYEGSSVEDIMAQMQVNFPDKKVAVTRLGVIYIKCANYKILFKKLK